MFLVYINKGEELKIDFRVLEISEVTKESVFSSSFFTKSNNPSNEITNTVPVPFLNSFSDTENHKEVVENDTTTTASKTEDILKNESFNVKDSKNVDYKPSNTFQPSIF
jgi:hypothetical protein